MSDKNDFPLGSTIWPSISNTGGNTSDADKNEMRRIVTEFSEYVAQSLERQGIPRFLFPLFRPFNAVLALTRDRLICVGAPLSGGVSMLRFFDWRDSLSVNIDQVKNQVGAQLGWADIFGFEIPLGLVSDDGDTRERLVRQLADDFSQQIKARIERQQRQVLMQPIFQTKPEDLELDDSLCFVLMPFQPAFDRIYQKVIEPAVTEAGLRPLRADQIFSPSPIVEDIWTHIVTARIIVADVSQRNPNVFYELGLAHAVGKPVIVIAQSKDDVPFDIAYLRYFHYADDAGGWKKLREDLRKAIAVCLGSTK